jgi:hypothetical protein
MIRVLKLQLDNKNIVSVKLYELIFISMMNSTERKIACIYLKRQI